MFIYVFLNLYGLILNFRHPETQVDFKQNLIFIFLKAKRDIFYIFIIYIYTLSKMSGFVFLLSGF
jgi:hypothetical protein